MNVYLIWIISFIAIAGVIIRPFKASEAVWAIGGAILLLLAQQISVKAATTGVAKGTDVYLFLAGMMLLSEAAREEKLFDWVAGYAVSKSNGSSKRLFLLIYLTGTVVTALLSNDATAVVLTPAVIAATRAANVKNALPYLLICAFIANAASFLLPISNPANLVIYQAHLPSLIQWLKLFLLPSALVIVITYFVLKVTQRNVLNENFAPKDAKQSLGKTGKISLYGIIATVLVLLTCSAYSVPLGLPTFVTALICILTISFVAHKPVLKTFRHVSWSVLLLVAGLFIIVEALAQTGITKDLAGILSGAARQHSKAAAMVAGGSLVLLCNLMNNLPVGLLAGEIAQTSTITELVRKSILIAVDLGPNLSVTGSLATILWLNALKREGITISGWSFLKIGVPVMLIPFLAIMTLLLIFNA